MCVSFLDLHNKHNSKNNLLLMVLHSTHYSTQWYSFRAVPFHGSAMLTFTHLIMMEENINKAADFGARKHFSIAATWSTLLGFNTETTATKMTLHVQGTWQLQILHACYETEFDIIWCVWINFPFFQFHSLLYFFESTVTVENAAFLMSGLVHGCFEGSCQVPIF